MKRINLTVGLILTMSGAIANATIAPTPALINPNKVVVEHVPVILPRPNIEATFSYENTPEVVEAYEKYTKTGHAPAIKSKGFKTVPYNAYTRSLVQCAPLHLCVIQLESGEQINNIDLGDSAHWLISTSNIGTQDQGSFQIVVKPQIENTTTDMVISTNKRSYNIGLVSKHGESTHVLSFYYPEEALNTAINKARKSATSSLTRSVITKSTQLDVSRLNFNYKTRGTLRTPHPIWQPSRIFDDGHKTFIQMPKIAKETDLPVLYLVKDHNMELVNYRYSHPYYIVDGLFKQAYLISGKGRHQTRLVITNNSLA